MEVITIAQLQQPVHAEKQVALSEADKACWYSAEKGADIVALPEMFCCPYET